MTLARKPIGGSLVIFTAICNTDTGNDAHGMEVSQRRNYFFTVSTVKLYTIAYSVDIHEVARWQFCNNTHWPLSRPLAMSSYAFLPWPWPSDTLSSFLLIFIVYANRSKSFIGSEPCELMNTSGVRQSLSLYASNKLNCGAIIKRSPMYNRTKFCVAGPTLSLRKHRVIINRCSGVSFSLHGDANG